MLTVIKPKTKALTVRSVHMCVYNFIGNTARNSRDNLPPNLQTNIIALILSIGG